jgi:hypothetical protein
VNQVAVTLLTTSSQVFTVSARITRGTGYASSVLSIVAEGGGSLTWSEDRNENNSLGITFDVSQAGDTISVYYTATNTGTDAVLTYSIQSYII